MAKSKTGQGRPARVKRAQPGKGAAEGSFGITAAPEYILPQLRHLAVPLDSLTADPHNARLHDARNLESIGRSLQHYGQRTPIVVRSGSNVILKGNGTADAARSLGWTHIAAVMVDDDDATAAGYAIADNRTAELATWDLDQLERTLAAFELPTIDVGFAESDLEAMRAAIASSLEVTPPDPAPADPPPDPEPQVDLAELLREKWGTASGQLWEITSADGARVHRLLCGDSTKAEDVGRLMGGKRAGLMNTDPPYGVTYANDERPNPGVAKPRVANDSLTDEKLQAFLESAFTSAVAFALKPNAAWYLWHAHLTQGYFAAAAANVILHRQIIWVKPVLLLGRGQYHWKHEPCFMGWVKGNQPPDYGLGNGERTQTTIWEVGGVSHIERRQFNHSTPKPTGLFTTPLVKHLLVDEIAYEPFAGTGPQFIAAEQTKRVCYGIELEERYVAVILDRCERAGMTPRLVT